MISAGMFCGIGITKYLQSMGLTSINTVSDSAHFEPSGERLESVASVLPNLGLGTSSEKFSFWFLLGKHIIPSYSSGESSRGNHDQKSVMIM